MGKFIPALSSANQGEFWGSCIPVFKLGFLSTFKSASTVGSTFPDIENLVKAQRLMNNRHKINWPKTLDGIRRQTHIFSSLRRISNSKALNQCV